MDKKIKEKKTAVLLAVFLSGWTYVYTWKKDRPNFVLFLAGVIIIIPLIVIGVEQLGMEYKSVIRLILYFGLWSMILIHTLYRKKEWYENYYNE